MVASKANSKENTVFMMQLFCRLTQSTLFWLEFRFVICFDVLRFTLWAEEPHKQG
jgi:hypothetical protein